MQRVKELLKQLDQKYSVSVCSIILVTMILLWLFIDTQLQETIVKLIQTMII